MNLEAIQDFCRSLPGTTEDMKWGQNLVFSVGLKMYTLLSLDNDPSPRLCFKTTPEDMLVLTRDEQIIPAPYLARHHWVTCLHLDVFDDEHTKAWIRKSYDQVFAKLTKKMQRQILESARGKS